MTEKNYIEVGNMDTYLLDELQNQVLSPDQLAAINNAPNFYEQVVAILKTVNDPEIPVNIWELGLIYHLDTDENRNIEINMTLTAPTCPVAEAIPVEVKKRLTEHLKNPGNITINLVWEPAWEKSMMSDEAKLVLDMW